MRESDPYLIQEYQETIRFVGDEGAVLTVLEKIDAHLSVGRMTSQDADSLRHLAFTQLKRLTTENYLKAQPLIVQYLLPYCFEQDTTLSGEVSYRRARYRQILVEWIDQYAGSEREFLREQALKIVLERLRSDQPKGACWTLSHLGLRRDDIVRALWEVVEQFPNDIGDAALSTLCGLGVPEENHDRLLIAVHEHLANNPIAIPLLSALRELASPKSIEQIRQHCLSVADTFNETGLHSSEVKTLAISTLFAIADLHDSNDDVQDAVWQIMSDLASTSPDVASFSLYLGSNIAPHCNSRRIVPFLLQMLATNIGESEKERHDRYLLCRRLEECVRPRHLESWQGAGTKNVVKVLREDARRDSKSEGRFQSFEMLLKEAAWNTLLRLGESATLAPNFVEKGVYEETNNFLILELSEALACFRLTSLPRSVRNLVVEVQDIASDDALGRWASRMAAIRLEQSAATPEAFQDLLHPAFKLDGNVLQRSVDALTDVSVGLAENGDKQVIGDLIEVAIRGNDGQYRTVATGTLLEMAKRQLLSTHHFDLLSRLLDDSRLKPFDMSVVVAALGYFQGDLETAVIDKLVDWARNDTSQLGWRSLETLARQGQLLSHRDLLINRLHLSQEGESWTWIPSLGEDRWAGFIVSILYSDNPPAMFTPAIAEMFVSGDWGLVAQLVRPLAVAHHEPDDPLPSAILDSLTTRIRQQQARGYAEVELLHLTVHLAPRALVSQVWPSVWNDWLPDARYAFADALGGAEYPDLQARADAVSLLIALSGDGQYAVRRSAYRGLARLSSDALEGLCRDWANSDDLQLRQRAAEACAWIASDERFMALHRQISIDRESSVRDAASRVFQERRERLWAQQYMSKVREVRGKTNREVLNAWPYATALGRIGDDTCIRDLREHLGSPSLPPHIRYWHEQTVKAMEERWRKVTQEWPDPWFAWEGTVEEGDGLVEFRLEQAIPVHYSLWRLDPPTLSEKLSWGGAAWTVGDTGFPFLRISPLDDGNFAVVLSDGRRGEAHTGSISNGLMLFTGQGLFPAKPELADK